MYTADPSCPHLVHRQTANQRDACRISCSAEPVAGVWLTEPETVHRDLKRDCHGGIPRLRTVAVCGGTCGRKANTGKTDLIHFTAAGHRQHNPPLADGGIRRDAVHEIPNPTDQRRVNMSGVINLEQSAPVACFDEPTDTASTLAWFKQIEPTHPEAEYFLVVSRDGAYDSRSNQVSAVPDMFETDLEFLASSAPNLNLMERFWKRVKKQVIR